MIEEIVMAKLADELPTVPTLRVYHNSQVQHNTQFDRILKEHATMVDATMQHHKVEVFFAIPDNVDLDQTARLNVYVDSSVDFQKLYSLIVEHGYIVAHPTVRLVIEDNEEINA